MNTVESYSFFCEDVRWESTGSPLLVGIMAPTFSSSEFPINFSKLNLFSFFKASIELDEFEAELVVKKLSKNSEEVIGQFSARFIKDESDSSPYQWVNLAVLPMEFIQMQESDTLCATVTINEMASTTYLTAYKAVDMSNDTSGLGV